MVVAQLQAGATSLAKAPKWRRTALADRLEGLEAVGVRLAWTPTHSAEQWSTATNTAAWPSPVTTEVRSVPHIRSTRSVVIVPSWALGPRGAPARWWARRPCSRMSRRTLSNDIRNWSGGDRRIWTFAIMPELPRAGRPGRAWSPARRFSRSR